jgi:DNA-binding transcriptional MocR family regulator
MFVWARLPAGWDAAALLPRALERDVAYVPGAHFFSTQGDPRTLRLSFTGHPPEEIELGLERLADALAPRRAGRAGLQIRASGAY